MKQILVVDDELGILDLCKKILELSGYKVYTALNAIIALEILHREKIDLVISDLKMPSLDGLSFCIQVKENWPQIGFILITGYWKANLELIEQRKHLFFCYLKKPFGIDELTNLVRDYFNEDESK